MIMMNEFTFPHLFHSFRPPSSSISSSGAAGLLMKNGQCTSCACQQTNLISPYLLPKKIGVFNFTEFGVLSYYPAILPYYPAIPKCHSSWSKWKHRNIIHLLVTLYTKTFHMHIICPQGFPTVFASPLLIQLLGSDLSPRRWLDCEMFIDFLKAVVNVLSVSFTISQGGF